MKVFGFIGEDELGGNTSAFQLFVKGCKSLLFVRVIKQAFPALEKRRFGGTMWSHHELLDRLAEEHWIWQKLQKSKAGGPKPHMCGCLDGRVSYTPGLQPFKGYMVALLCHRALKQVNVDAIPHGKNAME